MSSFKERLRRFPWRNALIALVATFGIVAGAWFLVRNSMGASSAQGATANPAFSAYVTSYTGGAISRQSVVRVRLRSHLADSTRTGQSADDLFSISPVIAGSAMWVDGRTVEFTPGKMLPSGVEYAAVFRLGEVADMPEELKNFRFGFQTLPQSFSVEVEGIEPYQPKELARQQLTGVLQTQDVATTEEVTGALQASQEGRDLEVTWQHGEGMRTHRFTVEQVQRGQKASAVELTLDGGSLGSEQEQQQTVTIPALGEFVIMTTKVVQAPDQYVRLHFSDPLAPRQNLRGIVAIEGLGQVRHTISGNELRVYPNLRQTGTKTLHVRQGLENIMGYRFPTDQALQVEFRQLEPALRWLGEGNIVPGGGKLLVPFEAVSLRAVDVRVIKVFADNMLQFLQVNELDGSYEMRRVGYPVLQKTVQLDPAGVTDLGDWNSYSLDLSELVAEDPGAMYQVTLGFRQEHSAFYCPGQEEEEAATSEATLDNEGWNEYDDPSYWDSFEDYYYGGWDWENRDNPCHPAYFGSRRHISKNLLSSDLGLIAKQNSNGDLEVFVTNLLSADPVSGVTVQAYSFQQQVLAQATTDDSGQASIALEGEEPFALVATAGTMSGYLKVSDGNALSLSNFDAGGRRVEGGLKGFIFGERDIWRPGDTVHLTFVLEDKQDLLPDVHPVVLELQNPQGQLAHRQVNASGVEGMYAFHVPTAADAPTGYWQARVKVGGTTFSKSLSIETIKPNRLKLDIDLGGRVLKASDLPKTVTVHSQWLHGAKAAGLRAEYRVVLRPTSTTFASHQEYSFDNPAADTYPLEKEVFTGRLDAQGDASFQLNLPTDLDGAGTVRARFLGRVFEQGGDFSTDRTTVDYMPCETLVGVRSPKGDNARGMLLTDQDHRFDLVSLDADGKPVANRPVEVSFYKLRWRWWWDSESGSVNYLSSSYNQRLSTRQVTTDSQGKASVSFRVDHPEWGRYLVMVKDLQGQHMAGKTFYVDWPGWAGRARREGVSETMLNFELDKTEYEAGEMVDVTFPAAPGARALVTVENGRQVLQAEWVECDSDQGTYSFQAKGSMAPNAYVSISLLQGHGQRQNDLPLRLFGVVPFRVSDPETKLAPQVELAETLSPNAPFTVKVTEANQKPMAFMLAVVDEGLLDITNYKTPDPWEHFYARDALGVKTWDLFEEVMGASTGTLNRMLALGGDAEAEADNEDPEANRFKPVVMVKGPFALRRGAEQEVQLHMPNYLGQVRVMVVAARHGAYGSTQQDVKVNQPLMVQSTLPRVLGPGEELDLPVSAFALDPAIKSARITVELQGPVELVGTGAATVSFADQSEAMARLRLKVKEQTGVAKIKVTAESGKHTSFSEVQVQVRNANPAQSAILDATLQAGETWSGQVKLPGMTGTNMTVVELSTMPPINLEKRLRYLLRYPYGCIEQTTSSAFPQLYLAKLMPLTETQQAEIQANVQAAIDKLAAFQNNDGSFSYWPGQGDVSQWGTAYACHFLVEAEKAGYAVPSSMLRQGLRYLLGRANNWQKSAERNNDLMQAFRLYVLANHLDPANSAMNRMRKRTDLSPTATWVLAAAYALDGHQDTALELTQDLGYQPADYRSLGYTYGSGLRDRALILDAMLLMGRNDQAANLMKYIADKLSSGNWYSTQTTAFCLLSMAEFAAAYGNTQSAEIDVQLQGAGDDLRLQTELPMASRRIAVADGQTISLENRGEGIVFVRVISTGIPLAGQEQSSAAGVNMSVVYTDLDGQRLNPAELAQGTEFQATVSVVNNGLQGDYEEMALEQIFPSGWEIVNQRVEGTADLGGNSQAEYVDIRDDRVHTFFDLPQGQRKTFQVRLLATYAGKYYLPAVRCGAMYDEGIQAVQAGQWVQVVP